MRHFAVVVASIFVAFLAAVVATVVDPQSVDASTRVKSCTGGKIELRDNERRIFVLQNRKRDSKDLPRLCVHPKLQKIARSHSKDMIERDYFSHNTKGSGRTPEQRAKRAGYNYRYFGENIAFGDSPANVFDMWMKSDDHRKNILNRKFKEVGIGAKTGHFKPAGGTTTVYTVDFGTRR